MAARSFAGVLQMGSSQLTIALRLMGGSATQLSLSLTSQGSSSSSSSSSGTGAWTSPPLARVDHDGRLRILVRGDSAVTMFLVAVQPGGTSVSSMSMDAASFARDTEGFQALELEAR